MVFQGKQQSLRSPSVQLSPSHVKQSRRNSSSRPAARHQKPHSPSLRSCDVKQEAHSARPGQPVSRRGRSRSPQTAKIDYKRNSSPSSKRIREDGGACQKYFSGKRRYSSSPESPRRHKGSLSPKRFEPERRRLEPDDGVRSDKYGRSIRNHGPSKSIDDKRTTSPPRNKYLKLAEAMTKESLKSDRRAFRTSDKNRLDDRRIFRERSSSRSSWKIFQMWYWLLAEWVELTRSPVVLGRKRNSCMSCSISTQFFPPYCRRIKPMYGLYLSKLRGRGGSSQTLKRWKLRSYVSRTSFQLSFISELSIKSMKHKGTHSN